MASLYNKFLDFIGIEESDEPDDEYMDEYRDDYQDDYRDRNSSRGNNSRYRNDYDDRNGRNSSRNDRNDRNERDNVSSFSNARSNNSARRNDRAPAAPPSNVPSSGGMKMIVFHPVSYEDTQNIIDNMKNRKPVIVNMEELDVACAQRILDFLSGAVYALNGTMCKISRGIFVVAPNNYDVVGNGEDEYDDNF